MFDVSSVYDLEPSINRSVYHNDKKNGTGTISEDSRNDGVFSVPVVKIKDIINVLIELWFEGSDTIYVGEPYLIIVLGIDHLRFNNILNQVLQNLNLVRSSIGRASLGVLKDINKGSQEDIILVISLQIPYYND